MIGVLKSREIYRAKEEEPIEGLHIGANRSSPVKDTAHYLGKIHYKIGNKLYIENSDYYYLICHRIDITLTLSAKSLHLFSIFNFCFQTINLPIFSRILMNSTTGSNFFMPYNKKNIIAVKKGNLTIDRYKSKYDC